ncbi:hypothetical protein ACIRLA_15550 [Streptomyces sp. NPDC102364]|uniref:hypothetical protein n=1 Tax=Streptomyces sp. NPDC102364 TaxID=3366161 RepID=UPI0037FCEA6A
MCDGHGTPLKVITTAANVNDLTQTLALVDGIPPAAGRPGVQRPAGRQELRLQSNIQGHGQAPLRRRVDLRPAPPLQTTRHPMRPPHRTPRCLRLRGLQSDLLATPQEGALMIVLRARRCGDRHRRIQCPR